MASTTFHDIVIQNANQQGDVTRQEALAVAGSTITPGLLLEHTAGAATVQEHATAAGSVTPRMIALQTQTPDDEDDFSIDVDYAAGDIVYFAVGKSGDRFYMWLAAGETSAVGSLLQSDGAGALTVLAAIVAATLGESVVGIATEAVVAVALSRVIVEII